MQRKEVQGIKILIYIVLLIILYALETASGLPQRFFGVRIDILPCVVMSAALLDGPMEGIILGFIAGILYDVGFTNAEGILPLYYMICGGAAGLLSLYYLRRIWPAQVMLSAGTMLLLGAARYGFSWIMQKPLPLLRYAQTLCGEILFAALLSPLIYWIVRAISRRFTAAESE